MMLVIGIMSISAHYLSYEVGIGSMPRDLVQEIFSMSSSDTVV